MIATLNIDNKEVEFKASASIVYKFKNYFNKDLLKILMPLLKDMIPLMYAKTNEDGLPDVPQEQLFALIEKIELTDVLSIIWIMAKTADKTIKDPEDWYDDFEVFPVNEVMTKLMPVLFKSVLTTEESKKKMMNLMEKA